MNCELEGRQSLSMSRREREIVPDGGIKKRKDVLSAVLEKELLCAAGSGKEFGLGLEQVVCWCWCQNMLLLLDTDDEVLIVTQNSKNANSSFLADCFKATEACPVLNPLILLQKGLYCTACYVHTLLQFFKMP